MSRATSTWLIVLIILIVVPGAEERLDVFVNHSLEGLLGIVLAPFVFVYTHADHPAFQALGLIVLVLVVVVPFLHGLILGRRKPKAKTFDDLAYEAVLRGDPPLKKGE